MSISGLSRCERNIARDRAAQAAILALHHGPELHYTQTAARWEGIDKRLIARKGQFPKHADCSSFFTWCVWNGVLPFDLDDIVNGMGWRAGYTGTMAENGREVLHVKNVLRADAVLYGQGPPYVHTAFVVGHRHGKPMVISNGSEPGPFLLPYDYRSDVGEIRRYI